MTGETAIEARGVTKRFGKVEALVDLNLDVPRGSAFGLLGPAGAGKSTIVRLIAGLARPTAGTLSVGGVRAGTVAARRGLGVLLQDAQLYGWMTGREALAFAADLAGVGAPEIAGRIGWIAERLFLGDALQQRVASVPSPTRGRLAIAQAIVGDPAILVLDEPFQWLDPDGRDAVLGVLRELRGSRTIILAAHLEADVEALCDRMAVLEGGRVIRTSAVVRRPPDSRSTTPEAAAASPRASTTRAVVDGLVELARAVLRSDDR